VLAQVFLVTLVRIVKNMFVFADQVIFADGQGVLAKQLLFVTVVEAIAQWLVSLTQAITAVQ
jgi:hypothetical protein